VSYNNNQTFGRAWWRAPLLTGTFLFSAVIFWLLATVPLRWEEQAALGASCLVLAIFIGRFWPSKTTTLILSILSVFSTFRYGYYRISETYNYLSVNSSEARYLDLVFVFTLLAAEFYAFVILVLGFFQTIRPLNRRPEPLTTSPDSWPTVDIYIPTYNEPLEVVRSTILAAMNIDWPAESTKVYILDDGRRAEFKEFAETCGCEYIIRPDNNHAKAGNINHALGKTSGEYIAIFDCDHIPTRSFLQFVLGWFLKDARLGMLQTPHHFYSPDPFERNLGIFRKIPNEGALFYGVIQDGSDFWNGTFFCGSCAVIRRTALEEVGGIAVETVTEDAHTSLRLQRRGWNTAYLRFPQAAGLATGSLSAHIGQRIRWARGMVQILRTDNPLFGKGLKLAQRLCYLNSMLHFLYAIPRLLFLTSPLVYLLLGYSNIYGYGRALLAYALPHLAMAVIANSRVQGRHRYSFWNEVYETVLAPYILLPTTVALISPKHGKFNVTSKSDQIDEEYFDWRLAAPYVTLLGLNFLGISFGIYRMFSTSASRETLCLNVLWCLLNSVILAAATAVARESKQRRASVRISAQIPISIVAAGGETIDSKAIDMSRGGFSIAATASAIGDTGDKAMAVFEGQGEQYQLPCMVIERDTRSTRFAFGRLTLEQEQQLIGIIFGRADSWLDWRDERSSDRPFFSFLNIVYIALQGLAAIAAGIFEMLRKSSRAPSNSEIVAKSNPALTSLVFLCGVLLFGAMWPLTARAQAAEPSGVFTDSYDLTALGHKEPLLLKGSDARTTISFGIPVVKVVTTAKLELQYRASPGLSPKGSIINLSLNGSQLASIPVGDSSDPDAVQSAEVELPSELLTSDNSLSFELKGRCSPGCAGETPATLWLRIERSTQLRMSGSILAIGNNLRLLPAPFFDGATQRPVVVQMAFPEAPDAHTLEAAGVVSSWLGTLADFRGAHFPVAFGSIPKGNVIVFASKESALFSDQSVNNLSGPVIALRDNPSDGYGKVLLVTGDNSEQILDAARALASGRYPRDGDAAEVTGAGMPPARRPYDAPRWLNQASAKLSPDDLRVYGNASVSLYFRLPADLYFGNRTYVPLQLSYQLPNWNSSMSGEMRIKLNGQEIAVRRISQSSGRGRQSARIGLPVNYLFSVNTLAVEFFSKEYRREDGHAMPEETVLRDSALDLSGFSHYVQMPRLDLFANVGSPFTTFADLSTTAVIVSHTPSTQQISLYLAVLGFFGARTGYPALRVSVIYPEQAANARDKHLLFIGGQDSSSSAAISASDPARIDRGAVKLRPPDGFFAGLLWHQPEEQLRKAQDLLSGDPAPAAYISEFVSPYGTEKLVVTFQAADPARLSDIEMSFAENLRLGDIYGNLSLLTDGQFHSFSLKSKTLSYGNLRWDDWCRTWLRNNFWAIPIALAFLALLLASQLHAALELRAKLRLHGRA
jgi:cellulose synthase (UDP-forming)